VVLQYFQCSCIGFAIFVITPGMGFFTGSSLFHLTLNGHTKKQTKTTNKQTNKQTMLY